MKDLFDVELSETDARMTRDELAAAMCRADVVVPTLSDHIDANMLAQAGPKLKLIANFGAGVDHIDVMSARQRGVLVSNTPGVTADDTADMAMALILGVTRRIPEGMAVMQSGQWQGWSPTAFLGGRVGGRRLGILGMGRIGLAVARRARAFGMQIHYHNRKPVSSRVAEELEATYWDSLDQMLARVDIVTVHAPATPATFHLLSARRLKLLQPHAFLINTARGSIIDEAALTELLADGKIAGAGLDVFEHEPRINPKLLKLPNVVLLPHMASATVEARVDMGEKVIINIKTWMDGHRPPDRVLPQML
jgi:glyoxylate reductase